MTTQVLAADQRATILAAAIRLLRNDGPNGLTVRKVAGAAGCSTTGVYTWFGGKNELVDAIFISGFESFRKALTSATANPGLDSLVALAVEYRRWAHAHPTEYQVMFARVVPQHDPSDTAQAAALSAFAVLVDVVEANRSDARLDHVDTELFTCHFWATVHGHIMLDLCGLGAESHEGDDCGIPADDAFTASITAAVRGFQEPPR